MNITAALHLATERQRNSNLSHNVSNILNVIKEKMKSCSTQGIQFGATWQENPRTKENGGY
jgi:hypothetical protein